jgi:hypothetical protein
MENIIHFFKRLFNNYEKIDNDEIKIRLLIDYENSKPKRHIRKRKRRNRKNRRKGLTNKLLENELSKNIIPSEKI